MIQVSMCSIETCPFDVYSYKQYHSIYCIHHEFQRHICIQCKKIGASRINRKCPTCITSNEQKKKPIFIPLYTYIPKK